jgi:hypothetical protein
VVAARSEHLVERIIFSDSKKKLEKLLALSPGKIRFLFPHGSDGYEDIREYLAGLNGSEEVPLADETRSLRNDFNAKYVELMAGVNQANSSFFWWAFYFTRKECLYTDLAQRIFHCYLIGILIRQSPSCDMVVITSDRLLARQLSDWAVSQGIDNIEALQQRWRLKDRIKSFTIARMAFTLLRAFHYWLMVKALCRISVNQENSYTLIGSLIDPGCFSVEVGYKDTYFGELPEFMTREGISVLVYGGLLKDAWKTLKLMRRKKLDLPVIPWHFYGTIPGMMNAAWQSLRHYLFLIELKGNLAINGVSVDRILKEAMKRDLRSGHFFESMWVYYSARSLSKHLTITACVIPFENRSWEKMLVSGLASNGDSIRTVGYHHASITPAHTQLMMGEQEAQVIPLPDNILMIGEVTKEILETSGNYPEKMLKVGCALRQGRKSDRPRPRNAEGTVANVLVALATSIDEYVNFLLFLDAALLNIGGYQVGIRPHPEFSLDRALDRLPDLGLNFDRMGGTLDSNFDWADVVVYVSSTVGLDAISVGVPAVNVDLGKFIDVDPAPDDCPLKWSVSQPGQLVPAFQAIENTSDSEYESSQKRAADFSKRYFHPVTDESLGAFSSLVMSDSQV